MAEQMKNMAYYSDIDFFKETPTCKKEHKLKLHHGLVQSTCDG